MARRKPQSALDVKALPALVKAVEESTGRGSAVLAFAWLDDALALFIRSRCVQAIDTVNFLFQGRGPLDSFLPRVHAARAFGLIDTDMLRELLCIRSIRNEFAHIRAPLTFADASIAERCRQLQIPALIEAEMKDTISTDQDRFLLACFLLAALLMQAAATPREPTDMHPITIRSVKGTGLAFEWIAKAMAIVRSVRLAATKLKGA